VEKIVRWQSGPPKLVGPGLLQLAHLVLSLRERENVLLISQVVEITPQTGGTCSYEGTKSGSSHIHSRIVGVLCANGLDEQWIGRPNYVIMASIVHNPPSTRSNWVLVLGNLSGDVKECLSFCVFGYSPMTSAPRLACNCLVVCYALMSSRGR
jgi:hypothetical protein